MDVCTTNRSRSRTKFSGQDLWSRGPKPAPSPGIPTRVIVGDRDQAVPVEGSEQVAEFHGTVVMKLSGMPHDLMLDQGADKVAERHCAMAQEQPTDPGDLKDGVPAEGLYLWVRLARSTFPRIPSVVESRA